MARPKLKTHIDWYASEHRRYEDLASVAAATIRSIMRLHNIDVLGVTYRAKTLESFKEKIGRKRYQDPKAEMLDLAGVRVVTFIDSDVDRAKAALADTFGIKTAHSGDKLVDLGADRFGYRSVHLVCDLGSSRTALPEFSLYKDMVFEVQIRTALQHAWAEIEHDRSYKFKGELRSSMKRRFHLVAGLLELADREFDSLSKEIQEYANSVHTQAEAGDLNIELNAASISEYLKIKLSNTVSRAPYQAMAASEELIDELHSFGCSGLADLEKILTNEAIELSASHSEFTTFSLLRDAMILSDPERYFQVAWKEHWQGWDNNSFERMCEKIGAEKLGKIVEDAGIDIYYDHESFDS
ncbi:hypothetical protein CW360_00010 [Pseudomonas fluvialis]|uniref:RelA/SpoT domain-containing protein n=1 Tax=Pseudomonas fluvialis TaxID=1793966 RepID=A0A2I0CUN9_9PSED|nr:hypothetical protein [Pseudomonas pharmacofabricae]PKF73302.1 hypothetical protein CW360_00010 [Pseudomonas pharmacofabricae]